MSHTYSECWGHVLSRGPILDRSYHVKILSNSRFSFSCFPCFLGFQHRAPDLACLKHWSWLFDPLDWIFCSETAYMSLRSQDHHGNHPQPFKTIFIGIEFLTFSGMFKCSNVQAFQCSNGQMFKCSNVQMFKCLNGQMVKCLNVQMFKGFNVQMFKWSNV